MIEVDHLTKYFGDRLALDDVSFRVESGKVTGFLGPNGAGKTTTMRLILGLDRPTSGMALIDGRALQDYTDPLCQVGALLDAKFAHPRRTAFNHLVTVATTHGIPTSRVREVLSQAGLEAVAAERVGKFSLGMTQRLGIATALLGSPRALILDEPINGLDVDGVRWFRGLCRDLADSGVAVFLSSHLMSEVELVADRVIVLGRGRVLQDAPLGHFRRGTSTFEVITEQAVEFVGALSERGAAVTIIDERTCTVTGLSAKEIGVLALKTGTVLEGLEETSRSLEDSYRELTDDHVEYRAGESSAASGS
ncbi:ATP-binding cassette domain-containing protein [Microbacterium protaetiae]|uniref:ATP-binding cassette domain-containing protein n=1 Tax=Microbacterium protaetiae TaxID=2509458 RepID=A0A4P6ED49_9MICO|nr:ATP-binding cassette domain-containing protein [Microbacterium protaetiae]QAY58969.1 ATP-binding cassette domain-containing protein [Microbacterium protaetiae]